MEKSEIKRISDLLSDVYEGICEDRSAAMQLYLTKLYRVIRLLTDEKSAAKGHTCQAGL